MSRRCLAIRKFFFTDYALDLLDVIGTFWFSKRRYLLLNAITIFFIIQLTLFEALHSKNKHSSDQNILRGTVLFTEAVELIVCVISILISCVDYDFIEKKMLTIDLLITTLLIGWIVFNISYTHYNTIFLTVNVLLLILLIIIDISTQRLKSNLSKPMNYNQFYRSRQLSGINNSTDGINMIQPAHMKHDFQSISPTISDEIEDLQTIRIDLNESTNGYSQQQNEKSEIETVINNTKIEFDGFRARMETLPLNQIQMPEENVPWSSFSFIEHRIDSSSCHIYTAIWKDYPVIIKLIKSDRINSIMAVQEFEMEANVLSRISHPNIVKLLGSGQLPRRFLILELLDGGSLSHALGIRPDANKHYNKKKFTYLQALIMAKSISSAMNYLHHEWNKSIHIIHR